MRHSQRGFTLIELLVAITLLSTLMTVVAIALGGLARADRKSRDRIDRDRNVHQLVRQLRKDIHEARGGTIAPLEESSSDDGRDAATLTPTPTPTATLTLQRDDGDSVLFQPTPSGMLRIITRGDVVRHRESYTWGREAEVTWNMDESHELPMVVLTLKMNDGPESPAEQFIVRTTLLNSQSNPAE